MGDERGAVRDGNERRERSGEDHFAGTEGHAEAAKRVRKPCHRIQRRALDGGADAGRYRFAILLDEQAGEREIDVTRIDFIGTQHIDPARRVVRHGVLDPDVPSGDAAVDDFKAGTRPEEHTYELKSLMRISYAVSCLQKTKYSNIYL